MTTDDQSAGIVVTANRREERLNSVPTAVSAFTAEDRTIRGINSTQDVAKFTPGVSISDSPNRVNVRGVGRVTNALGSDPGVANYLDGFYTSESDVIGSSDFLTQRVEILRGPQGTLYGRNSIGGAVNIISKRPTDDFQVEGRAFVNDYQTYGAGLSVSGPVSDGLRFRLAGIGQLQDKGYVRNLAGQSVGANKNYTVEGQVDADIMSNLNAWVRVAHTRYDRRPLPTVIIDPFTTVPYFSGLTANPQTNAFGNTLANPSVNNPYVVSYDTPGRQTLSNNVSAVTNITLNTPEVIVRFIGGYLQYDYLAVTDLDGTSRKTISVPAFGTSFTVPTQYVSRIGEDKRQYSGELNFLSTPGGDFDWIIGIYGYHEKLDQPVDLNSPNNPLLETPVPAPATFPAGSNPRRAYYSQRGQLNATALAVFGQISWRFAPTLSIDIGGRYSYDQKRGREDQSQVFFNAQVDPGNAYGIRRTGRDLRDDWGAFSGNVGLNYKPSDRTLAYAKISRGYKSGGFSLGTLASVPTVDQETVTAYEVGLKQGFGAMLQINSAAFYNDYNNQQVPTLIQVSPGVTQTILINAPKSETYGFETEINFRPVRMLSLSAIYSYLHAEFRELSGVRDETSTSTALQNLAGATLPQSPRHRLTLNGVVTAGPFDFSATTSWVGSQYYSIFNTDKFRAPAFNDTSLQLTYTAPEERFRLIARVTNLFDETSYSYVTSSAVSNGALRSVTPRLPRVFSLEGRFKF